MNTPKHTTGYANHLYFNSFEPENVQMKGTLLVLHGMQEHSGRYSEFAQYIANHGFLVITYDHLGHGKTARNFNEMGFFQKKRPAEKVINDARGMADWLAHKCPDVPHFILGHSMGSFIVRCLLQQAGEKFNGAVIVGTGAKITGGVPGKFILMLLNLISPGMRSKFLNNIFSKINNTRFKNENDADDTNWLSLSKSNRVNFTNDQLNGIPFTNNGFYALLSLIVQATKKNWSKSVPLNLPFLFVSGEDDPVGDFGKGVKETVGSLQSKGFSDVSIKLYPEMRHEILNEDIKYQVYGDINEWLEDHFNLKKNYSDK